MSKNKPAHQQIMDRSAVPAADLFKNSASGHSPVGGSSLHRVLACPASVRACHGRKESGTNAAAAEGTTAHELAEKLFRKMGRKLLALSKEDFLDGHDGEMADYIYDYYKYVCGVANGGDFDMMVEAKTDYSEYIPNGRGSADLVLVNDTTLHVFDLKYGMMPVDAHENPQLLSYLLGLYENMGLLYEFDKQMVHIVQPRIYNYSNWEVTPDRLDTFSLQLRAVEQLIATDAAPFNPGAKQCQWCLASGDCEAQKAEVLRLGRNEFDDAAVDTFSPNDLAEVLEKADMIENFVKAIRARAYDKLAAAHPVPGFKLVRGRNGPRQWAAGIDEDHIVVAMRAIGFTDEQMFKKSLVTPTQAEKLGFTDPDLVTQSEGKLSVAPESDKRPAVDVTEDFD